MHKTNGCRFKSHLILISSLSNLSADWLLRHYFWLYANDYA